VKHVLIVIMILTSFGCRKDKDANCEKKPQDPKCALSEAEDLASNSELPEEFYIVGATPGDGSIEISWSPSLHATNYVITRGTTDGIFDATAGATSELSFKDTGLFNGVTYYYMVSASNRLGTIQASERMAATPVAGANPTRKVSGSVSGLSGTLVLHINGSNALSVNGNGGFSFAEELAEGTNFTITIAAQPAQQTCSVANGTGKIGKVDISNVTVVCSFSAFAVGGNISGLSGTLILSNNGGNDLSISANGSFSFTALVAVGATYEVTVKTQPDGMNCSLTNGSGTMGSVSVSDVAVSCVHAYTISGNLSGLTEGTLILRNNNGDDLSLTADGAFTFMTRLLNAAAYSVSVHTNPSGHTCFVDSGTGTIAGSNITSVVVNCNSSIIVFATAAVTGNLGGRSGADNLCQARKVALSLDCGTNVRALISVDEDDEIRDMPALYEVPTNSPLRGPTGTLFHSTWIAAFGGSSALKTLGQAGIVTNSNNWWSGSTASGALDQPFGNCDNWTDGIGIEEAMTGSTLDTTPLWVSYLKEQCDTLYPVLCLCY